jgi:hypothetical protein
MSPIQRRILPRRQQQGGLDNILDLATVHGQLRELVNLLVSEGLRCVGGREERAPDEAPRAGGELRIVDGDVDARLEGGVEGLDAVGGEEEGAFVVFKDAEEDWEGVNITEEKKREGRGLGERTYSTLVYCVRDH